MDKTKTVKQLDQRFQCLLDDIYNSFGVVAEYDLCKQCQENIKHKLRGKLEELELTYFKRRAK